MNHFNLLVVIVCMLLVICCSSCVHGASTNTTSCSMSGYIDELENQIAQLSCTQKRLMNVVSVNTTLTGEIISQRQKQLKIVSKALELLIIENSILKTNFSSSLNTITTPISTTPIIVQPKQIVTLPNGGLVFSDGFRARSCNEYKNPAFPYQYGNQGRGLYVIEPAPGKIMTVYCDMDTMGGGWTLISGLRYNYEGIHFHTFEDSSASSSSDTTSFHIETSDLLNISTQVRAASDSSSAAITTFYRSNWDYSGACNITSDLRNAIQNTPSVNNGDLAATCFIISGLAQNPTHFTYGKTCNGHSTGFRFGIPYASCSGHMSTNSYATFSFHEATEGAYTYHTGIHYSFNGEMSRNGAVYLR